ncbi:hypothetical protein ACPXCJ_03305 [Micromonospora chalcea]|uniref:hypothetical protein n=1 Tax=Micromonospora chalcea TaxID=1874 RepID=UPI003CF63CE7
MAPDPLFVDEDVLDPARAPVESTGRAELFLYAGRQHLFAHSALPAYETAAAALLTQRSRLPQTP